MNKTCKNCQQDFEITEEDKSFYDHASPTIGGKKHTIPTPSFCPECRMQRRFSHRNERNLYNRKCDLSGKQLISNLGPHTDMLGYSVDEWWSDKWEARNYGQDYDFSRPFFEQYDELQKKVPQLSICVWNSENSDYCNYVGNVKNSYLIFGSVYSEDCYYGSPYYSENCVDTLVVRECKGCSECTDCRKLYECHQCQDCHSSSSLLYCYDLLGCQDCISCSGLRSKKYCVNNEQLKKEEYDEYRKNLNLCDPKVQEELEKNMNDLKLKTPHRFMQSNQVTGVSGNYVYESKNCHNAYYQDRSEDCRNCAQVVDLKDCYDNNFTEENEVCVDYLGAYQNQNMHFSKFSNKVSESMYCDSCFNSSNLFGCISIRRAKYCILNKQYTKEEYESLVPKIIAHMKENGEWGEFFPVSLSPFGYNESVAQEYYPLTRKQALDKGYKWRDEDTASKYQGVKYRIPHNIEDVKEDITDAILECEISHRPYKIIPQELAFYRSMKLPIPKICPDERHKKRMALRNPRKLWDRNCMKCEKDIQTTYSPDRPEIVYCEECYLNTVY